MSEFYFTQKRYDWAKNRQTNLLGTRLNYNAAIQQKYVSKLQKLVKAMTKDVYKQVSKLYKKNFAQEYFETEEKLAQDDSIASQARILMNALADKYQQLFNQKSKILADNMIEQSLKLSQSNLKSSLKELSGGLSLNTSSISESLQQIIKASIEENVSLIRSIPEQYFKDITGSVMRSIINGRGLADLVPEIRKYEGQTQRRAKNIALDQTRKAYNSINKQRLLELGVKKFRWLHSGGSQKPRKSHIKISGHIFSFDNLYEEQGALGVPESDRGIPGNAINCKCVMRPVIEFNED